MTRFAVGSASDIGRARSDNQDLALVHDRVFGVADGMGGHHGGQLAARLAVQAVCEHFAGDSVEDLVEAVQAANNAVVQRTHEDPELRGMGTTLTALATVTSGGGERIAIVNVGDSRAYLLGATGLVQVTKDHSLVALLVDQGTISAAEAERHPQRNIVTRALGIEERVLVDSFELVPVTGDRYLVCTDGLFNEVPEDTMAQTLRTHRDPDEAAAALVALANQAGGRDNITCVVVDVLEGSGDPELTPPSRVVDITTGQHRAVVDAEALARELSHPSTAATSRAGTPDASAGERAATAALAALDAPDEDHDGVRAPGGPPADVDEHAGRPAPPAQAVADEPIVAAPRRLDELEPVVPRRLTWRVGIFAAAVVAALLIAVFAVWFSANNTYFVGVDGEQVAIFRGRPGGVLWMDPSLEELSGVAVADLPEGLAAELEDGKDEGSLRSAREYVDFLEEEAGVADDDGAGTAPDTRQTSRSTPEPDDPPGTSVPPETPQTDSEGGG